MSRDIAFRAWLKKPEVMIYEFDILHNCTAIMEYAGRLRYAEYYYHRTSGQTRWSNKKQMDVLCDDYELMRSAGLFAKYKLKIYEGDILNTHESENDRKYDTGVVVQVDGAWMLWRSCYPTFKEFVEESIPEHDPRIDVLCQKETSSYQLIGNVFQDARLVKGMNLDEYW